MIFIQDYHQERIFHMADKINDDLISSLISEFQEINLNNYTYSDVERLNEWAIVAFSQMRKLRQAKYFSKVELLAQLTNKGAVTKELRNLTRELSSVYEDLDDEYQYFVNRAKLLIYCEGELKWD